MLGVTKVNAYRAQSGWKMYAYMVGVGITIEGEEQEVLKLMASLGYKVKEIYRIKGDNNYRYEFESINRESVRETCR
jgi:hypothetical protein